MRVHSGNVDRVVPSLRAAPHVPIRIEIDATRPSRRNAVVVLVRRNVAVVSQILGDLIHALLLGVTKNAGHHIRDASADTQNHLRYWLRIERRSSRKTSADPGRDSSTAARF